MSNGKYLCRLKTIDKQDYEDTCMNDTDEIWLFSNKLTECKANDYERLHLVLLHTHMSPLYSYHVVSKKFQFLRLEPQYFANSESV